ncbi:hypothetical protein [Peribacillus sp. TH14]|uniref:hypothetical protein n=1 Tax=Peribacillus sp. TH14 TaxID=2798481 RepID=UPI0019128B0A|nr:hypothetical protein [Peribacillus sp. TH14]MBK5500937.1 hypothetical protein [Peribacillus sp. TH14]
MKKVYASVKEFNWGIVTKYKTGDFFLLILFISTVKYLIINDIKYAIFCVLLMIWNEVHSWKKLSDN